MFEATTETLILPDFVTDLDKHRHHKPSTINLKNYKYSNIF